MKKDKFTYEKSALAEDMFVSAVPRRG
jgi:hypothetical protein